MQSARLVSDPELSALDLAIAPNGNIVVSSEYPFGASDAVTTVREYDSADGHLVRLFRPTVPNFADRAVFASVPMTISIASPVHEIVAFDFMTGMFLGAIVRMPRLHGQALIFFP
jgi:hypothetical protein